MVTIDGQLLAEFVGIAENCCREALASGQPVCVSLRDVTGIDDAGRDLLCRLAERGVRLRASGIYTSHLVRMLQRIAKRPR